MKFCWKVLAEESSKEVMDSSPDWPTLEVNELKDFLRSLDTAAADAEIALGVSGFDMRWTSDLLETGGVEGSCSGRACWGGGCGGCACCACCWSGLPNNGAGLNPWKVGTRWCDRDCCSGGWGCCCCIANEAGGAGNGGRLGYEKCLCCGCSCCCWPKACWGAFA